MNDMQNLFVEYTPITDNAEGFSEVKSGASMEIQARVMDMQSFQAGKETERKEIAAKLKDLRRHYKDMGRLEKATVVDYILRNVI